MSICIPVVALTLTGVAALVLLGWTFAAAATDNDDTADRP